MTNPDLERLLELETTDLDDIIDKDFYDKEYKSLKSKLESQLTDRDTAMKLLEAFKKSAEDFKKESEQLKENKEQILKSWEIDIKLREQYKAVIDEVKKYYERQKSTGLYLSGLEKILLKLEDNK